MAILTGAARCFILITILQPPSEWRRVGPGLAVAIAALRFRFRQSRACPESFQNWLEGY
ncbi:MAG: hypothetical protein IPK63_15830 [Candidatus Competibacteraceae bacterium]|nr:hypothetical protein [Candidatus Competibacteraceae bacterium]